jgi:hypothetical protein
MEVGHAPVLVGAERVEIMAELLGGHVFGVDVLTGLRDAEDAVGGRPAEVIDDHAGQVVRELAAGFAWVADAVARDDLQPQTVSRATEHHASVAVARAHLSQELHQLAEGMAPGHVGHLAPRVEVFGHERVIGAVARCRRVFGRRQECRELGDSALGWREVFHKVQRLKHHNDAVPRSLVGLTRHGVRLRRVKAIRARALIREELTLHASGQALVAIDRRDGSDGALIPRKGGHDSRGIDGHAHRPVKLTRVESVVVPSANCCAAIIWPSVFLISLRFARVRLRPFRE